ncbi:MAG: phosphoserine phosphatase RsbU/P [Methyloprofundus sp.]|nr:MAG: phosphoserine phosphatase RsbU/P [Methyloprofundus sp.]
MKEILRKTKDKERQVKELFRRFTSSILDQYTTVLFILALSIGVSYLVVIYDLKNQEGNATLIQLSTEQSQLVQAINFYATELTTSDNEQSIREAKGKMSRKVARLKEIHQSLKSGDRYVREGSRIVQVQGLLEDDLKKLYLEGDHSLDNQMRDYNTLLRDLQHTPIDELQSKLAQFDELFFKLSPPLLDSLNKASGFYKRQAEAMLSGAKSKQNFVFMINLGVLTLLGMGLLQPLVQRLQDSMLKAESEKNFADNVINTAQALIIGMDASANVVLFNEYAEENTGWANEEISGNNFFDVFIPASEQTELKALFTEMMSGTVEFADEIETQVQISTGEIINVIWHTTTILDIKSKQPVMFLATGSDITERKQAEENLQRVHAEMEVITTRLQGEVNLAATLQRSILPDSQIELPGIQGFANLLTSSEVGGDYYDYYKVTGHLSVILIGDVSGHGVAAGTMVSAAKAGVYPLIHEGITNPSEILNLLNETMLMTAQQSLLMTMNCLTLDAQTGNLQFANAGHVLPYLWRHQEQHWEMLEASGLPLGKNIESNYAESAIEIEMEVGDRLFLFTDGLVEEESPSGEAFGYDRLEDILSQCGELDAETIKEYLMEALAIHCETENFDDDVSIMVLTHSDRMAQEAGNTSDDISDIIRITESFYRQGDHPIPRISREYVVFIAEQQFADLLGRLSKDGICRILPKNSDFCDQIGWNHLLSQHHETPDDDLFVLMPHLPQHRQFQLSHTEDKLYIMEEIVSWISDQGHVPQEHIDALVVILDEMTENSLYAAPRDGKGVAYYAKGESRELSEHEEVRIDIALSEDRLGLMITDNWGTLPSSVFLQKMAHAMDEGVEAGVGGAGLYMMWRLSHYFQIRVHPQHRTQVTTLWDLKESIDMDINSGFQFIHHSQYEPLAQNRERA